MAYAKWGPDPIIISEEKVIYVWQYFGDELINPLWNGYKGSVSILRRRLTSIAIPIIKITRSRDRFIFVMEILIPSKTSIYWHRAQSIIMTIILTTNVPHFVHDGEIKCVTLELKICPTSQICCFLRCRYIYGGLLKKVYGTINKLRPRQNGCHFAHDVFKCIFMNGNLWISTKISLKFVPKGPINYIPAFVQIMAWRCPGNKPLSEAMMVSLPTHICVTRPQWVKSLKYVLTRNKCMIFCPLFHDLPEKK